MVASIMLASGRYWDGEDWFLVTRGHLTVFWTRSPAEGAPGLVVRTLGELDPLLTLPAPTLLERSARRRLYLGATGERLELNVEELFCERLLGDRPHPEGALDDR